ncbi:hypothetical protein CDAR_80471 [Caerostris darwini]|uniref:Uncharacterized protein n=1 Tax=Caerostris darwini TaxID=1538125 RepID=A0AAV4X2S7_9ARAC|nr:hypothetical protein CDAR_80471 [Caerostris darwini]
MKSYPTLRRATVNKSSNFTFHIFYRTSFKKNANLTAFLNTSRYSTDIRREFPSHSEKEEETFKCSFEGVDFYPDGKATVETEGKICFKPKRALN